MVPKFKTIKIVGTDWLKTDFVISDLQQKEIAEAQAYCLQKDLEIFKTVAPESRGNFLVNLARKYPNVQKFI